MLSQLENAAEYVNSRLKFSTETALILGTGLNSLADKLQEKIEIPYAEIPAMPVSTAPSHLGKLVAGFWDGRPLIILQGRLHYYEGYSMQQITFSIRLLKALGIKKVIITNAAGSLNKNMLPGQLVLLEDHINFMGNNPLIGKHDAKLGDRFPSMNQPYDLSLLARAEEIAAKNDFSTQRGVYLAVSGPSFETRAECQMFASWGADLVGMSTVPEVIVAAQARLQVLGISVVTNLSNIFHSQAHSQAEVLENALKAKQNLEILLKNII